MRLTDEVYVVGGGTSNAFGLTNDPDCHIYLVDGGDELALIDCGIGEGDSIDRLMANVRAEGLDPSRITKLLLTHYHMDHAGGAARMRERLGLDVVAPVGPHRAHATAPRPRSSDHPGTGAVWWSGPASIR